MRLRELLVLALVLMAGSGLELKAQGAGAFVRMGFGARGVAMSNALVADAFGEASPAYNPALAPFASRQNLEASAAFLTLDRELQFLQFAAPLRPRAGIAAGLVHAGVSGIDGRDGSGYHTQEYATDEFAFFLAFGTRVGRRLTAGLGLQIFRADYLDGLDAVNSLGLDAGLTLQLTPALHLGLALDDLLARYAWDTSGLYGGDGRNTTDAFPARLRVGGAYGFSDGQGVVVLEYEARVRSAEARTWTRPADGSSLREQVRSEHLCLREGRLRMGAEYRIAEPLALRAGIDQLGWSDALRPSAGFMVAQPVGELLAHAEYAFMLEPYAAGPMHFLTLRIFI